MKKLIAISVVFALVAGAVFAADVGVDVFGNVSLIGGSTNGYHEETVNGEKKAVKDDAGTSYSEPRIRIQSSAEDDNGTFGGWARFQAGGQEGTVKAWGYGWWKPIEQVRFLIGSNGGDGFFSADGVTRWNFYQVAGDVSIIKPDNAWGSASWAWTALNINYSSAFYGGWDNGALLTITPMEPLEINIGIPYGGAAKDVYQQTTVQVAYTIDGIGKFALTYQGGLNDEFSLDLDKLDDPKYDIYANIGGNGAKLFVYFGLTAIENLSIDVGFGYTLPVKPEGITGVTYNAPIGAGLGVTFNAGDFGVKFRTVANLAGKFSMTGVDDYKLPLELLFDVLPYYAVNENVTVLLSAGAGYQANDKDKVANDDESRLAWHVQPYITIKSSWWAPNFYAGIRLETNGKKTYGEKGEGTNINWSVPVGIAFSF